MWLWLCSRATARNCSGFKSGSSERLRQAGRRPARQSCRDRDRRHPAAPPRRRREMDLRGQDDCPCRHAPGAFQVAKGFERRPKSLIGRNQCFHFCRPAGIELAIERRGRQAFAPAATERLVGNLCLERVSRSWGPPGGWFKQNTDPSAEYSPDGTIRPIRACSPGARHPSALWLQTACRFSD
jgi:hypothetical protein